MISRKNSLKCLKKGSAGYFAYLSAAFVLTMLLAASPSRAQITSNGTGGGAWTSTATWNGGVVPDSTVDVVIAAGDSVYTSTSARVTAGNLDIQSGGKLNVLGGSSGGSLGVLGALTVESGAWFYNSNSSLTGWPSGASGYIIDPASNYMLTSAGSSTIGSNQADSTFGNYYDYKANGGTSCGANLTILGDLIINTGSTSNTLRGISATTAASAGNLLVHHVTGNATLITGVWSAVDGDLGTGVAMTCVWDIGGNVTIGDPSTASGQARFGPFTSANSNAKIGVFNIGGNLKVTNGARLQCGSSSSDNATTEIGEINLKGNLTLDSTAAVAGNTFGQYAINFVGTGTQNITLKVPLGFSQGSTGAFPTFCDTVASGATAVFTGGRPWGRIGGSSAPSMPANGWGTFIVKGTLRFNTDTLTGNQNFEVASGGTLGVSEAVGVDTSNAGNIQVTGSKSFSTEGSYLFDGTTAQVTGNACPLTLKNLTVSDTAGLTLAGNTTVNGVLSLQDGGKLIPGSNTVYVANKHANAVVGDSVSYVEGSLARADSATGAYLFPIGDAAAYHGAMLNFTTAPSSSSDLTASFTSSDPSSSGLPAGISDYWKGGYWTLSPNNSADGVFTLDLYAPVAIAVNPTVTIIGKAVLSDAWTGLNLTATHSSTVDSNWVSESGVSSYGIYGIGFGTITSVKGRIGGIPTHIALGNYPNPFNPTTDIRFAVPKNGRVTLIVYNYLGQKIATLVDQNMPAGYYDATFDGSSLASGVYLSRLSVGSQSVVNKIVLIK